jgi:SAM-dependent methyltransferase
MSFQEDAFVNGEADAWVRRNPNSSTPAPPDDPVLAGLARCDLAARGTLLDAGGAAGRLAAGFLRNHPAWAATVVDPSKHAVAAGSAAFPGIEFHVGSLATPLPPPPYEDGYDVVIVSGVLCWIDRGLLSLAVAHTDSALRNGGLLVICDFDAPYQRANRYVHREGLFTYKQDYAACFCALGTYHVVSRTSYVEGTAADATDPYDRTWATSVLRKDLYGRYARSI